MTGQPSTQILWLLELKAGVDQERLDLFAGLRTRSFVHLGLSYKVDTRRDTVWKLLYIQLLDATSGS